ncbi:beta-N-acetylhexosaminidase [Colwellia sp. MB02u-18]|uniref:beta-N-acetylhexosaminidase n=1 Tax=unclassified Colwellia TaxID=196834 RepID=UPI0015F5F575|nr:MULTISPECIES: beta-N-acetylhexosaminidase [unclassified Colwellia]MBA6266651.1 beta-N-acetylhexosaminidase [Colwellia sp. MB3u-43]MBA6225433.1 beta-N-acetylhexosaminidase [Colwellia sp. MB3u-45]MBA6320700.1 beta-N-acetylhexosaminidase [Colwellia sp. MB02u-19]MBA6323215.1 beta-N-acetylhexosaminidase [Colwellia sp. MB02u-18]MBA6329617.1 beta-N-acetylhexosaminidase [Colwellia sp. MB02u-12]
MGPVMFDVQGTSLSQEDKEILQHPLIGGLIFFTRNYQSPEQMADLSQQIRMAAKKPMLLAVDHEGGRVQRFREGFSLIPAMGKLWRMSEQNLALAKELAKQSAILMALEVQAVGIDISFAPVLDINNISDVIGDRAFHQEPDYVTELAEAFISGLHLVGMKATGKHFPGHGSVKADSHIDLPIDTRTSAEIFQQDLMPFKQLINKGKVDALMPAHIIFPDVDSKAVGFSRYWLQNILREQLGFNGVIFSDDLSMQGAASIGGYIERAEAAQAAGCDMLLLCNNRDGCVEVLDNANISTSLVGSERLNKLLKTPDKNTNWSRVKENVVWQQASQYLNQYR